MSDPASAASREDPRDAAVPVRRRRSGEGGGFRPDVQGLRALAVTMVVVYHLCPSLVPNRPAGEPAVAARVPGHWVLGCLTVAVVAASLAYSVHETRFNPAAAYFITPTRIWELGAGGLLALLPERIAARVARLGWLSWAGLALAISSAFVLRGTSAFPGYALGIPDAVRAYPGGAPGEHRTRRVN